MHELFACRHVYQFSKVFVGEQTMSRSASSSVLRASSQRVAVTTASFLPSRPCLISDRVMPPDVPLSSPSEVSPVLFSRPLVQSPSSHVSCYKSLPSLASLPDADGVCSTPLTNTQVNSATCSCSRLRESQVIYLQNYNLYCTIL